MPPLAFALFVFDPVSFAFEALDDEMEDDEFGVDEEEELVPNQFPTIAVAVDTKLDVLFLDESSAENTWIVPWLLEATNKLESGLCNHAKTFNNKINLHTGINFMNEVTNFKNLPEIDWVNGGRL